MADEEKTPAQQAASRPGHAKTQAIKDTTAAVNAAPATGTVKPVSPTNPEPTVDTTADLKQVERDRITAAQTPVKWSLPSFVSLDDVQNIYAALRDGDYWSAMSRAVRFLDQFLNPVRTSASNPAAPPAPMSLADADGFDRLITLMDRQLDSLEGAEGKVSAQPRVNMKPHTAAQIGTEIDMASVTSIVDTVVTILRKFRRK